jgi:hypothetical protein
MNLLSKIKEKTSDMKLIRKLALLIVAPLALIAFILNIKSMIQNALHSSGRKETDEKHEEMKEKMKDLELQAAKHEGRMEELERKKQEAIEKADQEDPLSFHNRRKK